MTSDQRKTALRATGWKIPFLCEVWGVHRTTVIAWLEGEHAPPDTFDPWLERAAHLIMDHAREAYPVHRKVRPARQSDTEPTQDRRVP